MVKCNRTLFEEIYGARNKTKRRCNVYYYEAMGNIARAHGFTASEFFFGCAAMAMQAMKCEMPYLTEKDFRTIKGVRDAIVDCKTKTKH